MKEKRKPFPNPKTITSNPEETMALGEALGQRLKAGMTLKLVGDLGSGKTTLMKGIARGLQYRGPLNAVSSPTYTLVKEYACRIPLYHIDLYRFDSLQDHDRSTIYECMQGEGITAIEWADKVPDLFENKTPNITLRHHSETERSIEIKDFSE